MKYRRSSVVTATVIAMTTLVVLAPGAEAAPITPGATAYSAAGYTGSGTMHANLTLTGSLGSILNTLIGSFVSTALDPLVALLQGTASSVVGATLGATGPNHATTPTTQGGPAPAAFPADLPAGLPSPCSSTSATLPCYSATSGLGALNVPPLVNLALTAASGYTQQVPAATSSTNQIFGRAQAVGTSLSVLPGISSLANPLISTGTIDSTAVCPSDGTTAPSAHASAANIRLLGGLITFTVASDKIASLVVNGTSYGTVAALPTVNVAGVIVQPYGIAVEVTLPLSLAQVAAGLGLGSSVITSLGTYGLTGTGLSLSIVVGPETIVTNTSAQAWGLGLGVDLSGSLGFNILGLAGATISVPTGIGASNFGNVLDLRLGYTACTVGSSGAGATRAVPPALV